MTRTFMRGLFVLGFALMMMSGCATPPKSIPTTYYQGEHKMSVTVTRCSDTAQIADSGQGGLIGAMVTSGRGGNMRQKMEGIKGETVRELVRQKVSEKIEDYFEVVDEDAQLAYEMNIYHWGWFVPTTAFGIKTGSYQLMINGEISVYDLTAKKKSRIAYVTTHAEQPLGNDPQADVAQEALLKAIDDFALQSTDFMLKDKPQ